MAAGYRFGDVEVRQIERQLMISGEPAALGARAFDLLLALIERRDRVVSKSELFELVWPGLVVEENNLQVQVSSLRKMLGAKAIATVPGRGYRFTCALDDAPAELETNSAQAKTGQIPARTGLAAPATNLPAELAPLYGREADLPALRSLIEKHRIVTVVGAGGIGKTALAQALAHQLRDAYEDGVWLVELAPIAEDALVATTLARALQVTLRAEAQVESLATALSARRMLIVLDNCEHLLQGVARLSGALHGAAPGVRILTTSQEPLKIASEQIYRLGTLGLPAGGSVENARQAGAVALFEARARCADPHFRLGEDNIASVAEICRRLDGIALAIELAAARVPLLGVEGLRARLDERFRVLSGGARLALRRHQTLRAALEWSHGLLKPDEQTVFRRLGVFVGGFGLESARHAAADARIDPWAVLDALSALVDKSLVVAESGREPRYRLLETNRAYALEKLHEAGETDGTMRRHAEAVLATFEASRREEFLLTWQERLKKYLPDLDNARAALEWSASAADEAQLHIALAGAMAWIWRDADLRPEGMRRTESAAARIQADTPPALEARLRGSLTRIAFPLAGPRELAADARAVELLRGLGDRRGLFTALCRQAITCIRADRLDDTELALQEAERLFETEWPQVMRAEFLLARSWICGIEGQPEAGLAATQELLQLATAVGDQRIAIRALVNLEQGVAELGRLEESVALGRDMLERIRQDHSLRGGLESVVMSNLSMSLTQLDQIEEALALAREGYPSAEGAGRVLELLDPYALLAFKRGRVDDATRIVGRAVRRFAAGDVRRGLVEQKIFEALSVKLREVRAPEEIARLMKEGEELTDEQAAQLALLA